MFVPGGLDAVRHPDTKIPKAETVTAPVAAALGLPDPPGRARPVERRRGDRRSATRTRSVHPTRRVHAASLVPTTVAGHRFWAEADSNRRAAQRTQFLKNAAMLGGLTLVVADGTRGSTGA